MKFRINEKIGIFITLKITTIFLFIIPGKCRSLSTGKNRDPWSFDILKAIPLSSYFLCNIRENSATYQITVSNFKKPCN